jgi:hypothetical protein
MAVASCELRSPRQVDHRSANHKTAVRMRVSKAHHSELRILVRNGTSDRTELSQRTSTTSSPAIRSKWRTLPVATRQPRLIAVAATMRSCGPTSEPVLARSADGRACARAASRSKSRIGMAARIDSTNASRGGAVFRARAVHSVKQLAGGDGRNCGFFIRTEAFGQTLADELRGSDVPTVQNRNDRVLG